MQLGIGSSVRHSMGLRTRGPAAFAAASASKAGALIKPGLMAQYACNEGSGSVMHDMSGNGHHATLGLSGSLLPSWSSKGLVFSGAQLIQMPASLNNFAPQIKTVMVACSAPTGKNTSVGTIFATDTTWLWFDSVGQPGANSQLASPEVNTSLHTYGDNVYTWAFGNPCTMYFNGAPATPNWPLPLAAGNITSLFRNVPGNFWYGYSPGAGYAVNNHSLYYLLLYDRKLSSHEVVSNVNWLQTQLATRSIVFGNTTTGRAIICDGDSLTGGIGTTSGMNCYPAQVNAALTSTHNIVNLGIGGQQAYTMMLNGPSLIDPLYGVWSKYGAPVVCIWGGINDINGITTPANAYSYLKSYWAARRAAGFKVVAFTILPFSTGAYEGYRQTLNSSILSDQTLYDAVCDVGNDATIGQSGDQNNTTYYSTDKIHLIPAGYSIVAGYVETALSSLGIS